MTDLESAVLDILHEARPNTLINPFSKKGNPMPLYANPIDFLKKMEEVLRTSPRKNSLSGLYIEIGDDTAINWAAFLREMIAAETPNTLPDSRGRGQMAET